MINYCIEPTFKCENNVKFESQPINDIIYEGNKMKILKLILKPKIMNL